MTTQPADLVPIHAALATPKCRVGEYFGFPIAYSLVAEATLCAIERDAMLKPDQMVTLNLSDDMRAYLKYEAERRRMDIWTVYEEEMAAEKRARAKALSREELKSIARNCTPDPRHLVVDDDPF